MGLFYETSSLRRYLHADRRWSMAGASFESCRAFQAFGRRTGFGDEAMGQDLSPMSKGA
jgi:hypothetical protein